MNLYIDIDGFLLGRRHPDDEYPSLARHANEFLDFALLNFECHWLTTHCDGDVSSVLRYLRPYCDDATLANLTLIKPTRFRTWKTEALRGDFLWLDDCPLATEILWLKRRKQLDRWVEVNTRKRPDDLQEALAIVKARLNSP